jgi:hypothetical protein
MDGAERSKRIEYLDRMFPPALSWEGHAPGPFTERAVEYLARPIPIDLSRTGRRYIIVDAIESNGNPIREVVRFRFRLQSDSNRWKPPSLGGLDDPISGHTEVVYYFHFQSDSSLRENEEDLLAFIYEHLGEVGTLAVSSKPEEAVAGHLGPDWSRLAMISLGFLGITVGVSYLVVMAVLGHGTLWTTALTCAEFVLFALLWLVAWLPIKTRRRKIGPTGTVAEHALDDGLKGPEGISEPELFSSRQR